MYTLRNKDGLEVSRAYTATSFKEARKMFNSTFTGKFQIQDDTSESINVVLK